MRLVIGLLAALAAASLPWLVPEPVVTAAIVILFNCYLAQCWNLAAGYAGQFSLGHALFLGIGGYTSSVLLVRYGVTPWFGMLLGALLAALAGAALSAVAFRYRVKGVFFAVVTLSAVEIVRGLFDNWDLVGGTGGMVMVLADAPAKMMFMSRTPYYLIMLGLVAAVALGTAWLERTRFGKQLEALREDEEAAEATGVRTFRCKVAIIALSAFFTAFAGTFYAQFLLFIVPETLFSFDHMLTMMLGAMVGGAGTVVGPILGGALFGTLSEFLRTLPFANSREVASLLRALYAIILMVVVTRFPGGLVSIWSRR